MTLWLILNSIAIVILVGGLYLVIRQIGIILSETGGPRGARSSEGVGPRTGENISPYVASLLDGRMTEPRLPALYVFISNTCPICRKVHDAAQALGKNWRRDVKIVIVEEGRNGQASGNPGGTDDVGRGVLHCFDDHLRQQLSITGVPYGVMVDVNGVVIGKGLVNHASHLESLLELALDSDMLPGLVDSVAADSL